MTTQNGENRENAEIIDIRIDGEVVASLELDAVQDSYPWHMASLVPGPALPKWRAFVDAYVLAGIEIDFCPGHPDEGPYEETDLAAYIAALRALLKDGASTTDADEDDPWLDRWRGEDPSRLEEYIAFLDWRRWRASSRRTGQSVPGIPLPPALDIASARFGFHM